MEKIGLKVASELAQRRSQMIQIGCAGYERMGEQVGCSEKVHRRGPGSVKGGGRWGSVAKINLDSLRG